VTSGSGVYRSDDVRNLLNYIRIEKNFTFNITVSLYVQPFGDRGDTCFCEPLWSIRLNCQLMTKLEMMHILQAQVCGCISARPGLPHQITKRETKEASKSQLNQASWNRTVLKFVPENQLNFHISFKPFLLFSLDRTVWIKSRHYQLDWVCAAYLEYRPLALKMWKLLAFEYTTWK